MCVMLFLGTVLASLYPIHDLEVLLDPWKASLASFGPSWIFGVHVKSEHCLWETWSLQAVRMGFNTWYICINSSLLAIELSSILIPPWLAELTPNTPNACWFRFVKNAHTSLTVTWSVVRVVLHYCCTYNLADFCLLFDIVVGLNLWTCYCILSH